MYKNHIFSLQNQFIMFKSKLTLGFSLLVILSLFFYSCGQKDSIEPNEQTVEQSYFQKTLADHTQLISVEDQGNGTYSAIGAEGAVIEINDALVNAEGDRIRGAIEIKLIEIYSMPDMVSLQKQTLADYDGQLNILESGGEIFIKIYQNGEEVFADGNGTMEILVPTQNTGGAKENMELFYGEETGSQVIWKPTGVEIRVINTENREDTEFYQIIIQDVLGWINIDKLWEGEGEIVDCINIIVDCPEMCDGEEPIGMIANIYVNNLNSAFDIPYNGSSFELCGGFPLGGTTVSFIVVIQCPDGSMYVSIVTTTVNAGNHTEVIKCDDFTQMGPGQFEEALLQLL